MEREIDYIFNNYTIDFPKIVNPLFSIYSSGEIEHLFDVLDISADAFIKNRAFNVPVNFDLSPIVNFLASKYTSNKIHLIEGEDPASYALYNFKSKKKILR